MIERFFISDFQFVFTWWLYLFVIGLIFLPIANYFFRNFFDKGYIFSKTIGIIIVSYLIFIGGTLHILPFQRIILFIIPLIFFVIFFLIKNKLLIKLPSKKLILIFTLQEFLFLLFLTFWSFIKGFQPDIQGLEKFMDFGFINSILRSNYFPPTDIWFTPESINYYYFGHLVTAVLIKLTGIPASIAYNLMLATILAFTITCAFSIASTIISISIKKTRTSILGGILTGIITAFAGNMHTLYTLFTPYSPPENPVPFWKLAFEPLNFPNSYWYPNATRFIPYTIHEFPAYSFVVSDLHGHVLDIPFVFLTLALILSMFLQKKVTLITTITISFMLSVMYMTNAWDGIIYFLLFTLSVLVINFKPKRIFETVKSSAPYLFAAASGYVVFSLPFNINFKPFVSGVGVVCAPDFLIKLQNIGPLIFEAEHCQRSQIWMILILYGFFFIFSLALIGFILKNKNKKDIISLSGFLLLLIFVSFILILTPEFIYAKDIYPQHYRANTMFKLGYQAFMMLSLVSGTTIAFLLSRGKRIIWLPVSFLLLTVVLIYPYFATMSYFGELKNYRGVDGTAYLKTLYPDDYRAINWIQKNIAEQPVLLESQGDSYTDHGRISANTGLPTVLGWTVHEWLWRGSYDIPAARLDDVRALYEDGVVKTKLLVNKYNISYVYIGDLERQKYPKLDEKKFNGLGKVVFQSNDSRLFKLQR